MYLGDPNITKKGLLALKDSKPVPITAHSHEIVVPCIYTETVKKIMKQKGIELPLPPAKLAEARKLAKTIPGTYQADPEEKASGSSHAKGTTNVTVNIKNVVQARHARRGRKGRSRIIVARASGLVPAPSLKRGMMVNPNYSLIRPFVANTPIGFEPKPAPTREEIKKELEHENALERRLLALEGISKRAEELRLQEEKHVKEQIVRPDDFVDLDREEDVRKKMRPSEVHIEDISAPSMEVKQPEEHPPRERPVGTQDLDRAPLLEKLRSYKDLAATLNRAFDKKHIVTMYQTLTGKRLTSSSTKLKETAVQALVRAVEEEPED